MHCTNGPLPVRPSCRELQQYEQAHHRDGTILQHSTHRLLETCFHFTFLFFRAYYHFRFYTRAFWNL